MKEIDRSLIWFLLIFYFTKISILVYNMISLYNEIWVKKAHLNAKSGSLQGCHSDKEHEKSFIGIFCENVLFYIYLGIVKYICTV